MLKLEASWDQYVAEQQVTVLALRTLRRLRRDPDRLVRSMVGFQAAAVQTVVDWTGPLLSEQGLPDRPVAAVNTAGLLGWASDGRPLASLVTQSVTDWQFDRIVETQLTDVARQAAAIERAVRPEVTHYVRAVNPGACSRCLILAGRVYRTDRAFARHPRCRCLMVPTTEDGKDLATSPEEAIRSMTQVELERTFTKAGAEAIRLGADPAKVVNARRGMSTAQPVGEYAETRIRRSRLTGAERETVKTSYHSRGRLVRDDDGLYTTSEGTGTRRSRREARERAVANGVKPGGPRLMPESIIQVAESDAERVRLLKAYGYIL